MKRKLEVASCASEAAEYNMRVMRKLQRVLEADPEADLTIATPMNYRDILTGRRKQRIDLATPDEAPAIDEVVVASKQFCTSVLASSVGTTASVVSALADFTRELLGLANCEVDHGALSTGLKSAIANGCVIWQHEICVQQAVVKCNETTVVKIVPDIDDYTEYASMEYLAQHAPDAPAPRPLGVIKSNTTAYIFMSYMPGTSLAEAWPTMRKEHKASITNQLNDILSALRRMNMPDHLALGGVGGEGCKDSRRHTRKNQIPIKTCDDFEDFRFSNPHFGSPTWISLLRDISPCQNAAIVFTHGDLRRENIIVKLDQHGDYIIAGLIDWEKSGFYPEYHECIKATNNLSPTDADDWYDYLPSCASPRTYPQIWAVDRLWDKHVA